MVNPKENRTYPQLQLLRHALGSGRPAKSGSEQEFEHGRGDLAASVLGLFLIFTQPDFAAWTEMCSMKSAMQTNPSPSDNFGFNKSSVFQRKLLCSNDEDLLDAGLEAFAHHL